MVVAMTRAAAIPHCHFFDDVAVDRLLQVRAAQQSLQLHGQRLTLLPFLLKVHCAAPAACCPIFSEHLWHAAALHGSSQQLHVGDPVSLGMQTYAKMLHVCLQRKI